LSLLTHKSQCSVDQYIGLVISVQEVNQSHRSPSCEQLQAGYDYQLTLTACGQLPTWSQTVLILERKKTLLVPHQCSSRKSVGDITIGCLGLNNTLTNIHIVQILFDRKSLVDNHSHVAIQDFNHEIILTGKSVLSVTGVKVEITCPTFSAISLFMLGMTSAVPHTFTKLEYTVTADIARVTQYCQRWRLKPSSSKTVSSAFHLRNTRCKLSVEPLKHDAYPVNVSVTLDQILKYKQHLSVENFCQAQDLEHKLDGTSCGAYAKTLHTSALALRYSAAEYCCPAWSRPSHTASIDCQLDNTMRLCDPPRFHGCQCWPI